MKLDHKDLPVATQEDVSRVGQFLLSDGDGTVHRVIGPGVFQRCSLNESAWPGPTMTRIEMLGWTSYRALTEDQAMQQLASAQTGGDVEDEDFISFCEGKLEIEDGGDGEMLVTVHGDECSADSWRIPQYTVRLSPSDVEQLSELVARCKAKKP